MKNNRVKNLEHAHRRARTPRQVIKAIYVGNELMSAEELAEQAREVEELESQAQAGKIELTIIKVEYASLEV